MIGPSFAAEAARGVLHHGVAFGQDVFEQLLLNSSELRLHFIPFLVGGLDEGLLVIQRLATVGGLGKGSGVQGGEMGLQALEGIGDVRQAGVDDFFIGHAQGHTAQEPGRVERAEHVFPLGGPFTESFLGLVLKQGFNAVDLGHDGLQPLDGALVP